MDMAPLRQELFANFQDSSSGFSKREVFSNSLTMFFCTYWHCIYSSSSPFNLHYHIASCRIRVQRKVADEPASMYDGQAGIVV